MVVMRWMMLDMKVRSSSLVTWASGSVEASSWTSLLSSSGVLL